ncbi:caspase family protein [Streptomyces microflavus]|uniref:caspase, EACC1-associated type n=1 Tax=Streptomyces microflavus TaxID=1919 RepID=UPI00331D38DD
MLPDPNTSRAILIGTSRYTDPGLTSLPAVAENLKDLARLLRDPGIWGLPKTHCTVISNPSAAAEVIDPIIEVAQQATDTLLVYYAGHGLIARRDAELHLALTGSRPNAAHTALPYATIRDELLNTRARRQVVILDCCYSGRALGRMASADAATVLADEAAIEGTYLIAAAAETRTALSVPGEPHTAFTAELLTTLRRGIPGQGPHLDLDTIYRHVETTLRAKQRPLPQRRIRNTADRLAFYNRAHVPAAPTPSASEPAPPAEPPGPHPGVARDTRRGVPRRAFIAGAVVLAGAGTATGAALWPWGKSEKSVRSRRLTDVDTEDVAFSPDGRTFVTIESRASQVWDAVTGKVVAEVAGDQSKLSFLAFSPDGKTFATSGGNVLLRDAATAVPISTFASDPARDIVPLAFSPDGQMLACGGARTGTVDDTSEPEGRRNSFRLLDISTGRIRATSLEHNLRAVAFSPDGKTIACTGGGGCWLWNVAGRRFSHEVGLGNSNGSDAVLFTPDGQLVTAGEYGVRLWDATSLRIKASLPTTITYAVALNRDCRTIATAGPYYGVQLWDLTTRRLTATLTDNTTHSLAWSPDGRTLAGVTSQYSVKNSRFGSPYDSGCLLWQIPTRLLPTSSGNPPTHSKG